MRLLRDFVLHLRLPFQLLLAPIFLWGALAAGRDLTPGFILGFLVFHVCLYGGATVFNSYFDRDLGPIGGLKHPPPLGRGHLLASICLQFLGLGLATRVSERFALLYLMLAVLGAAYSHPSIRLKAHPWSSLLAVSLGQGAGAFFGGYWVSGGELFTTPIPALLGGLLVALLLPTGLYPLTQVYQIEEDRRRGDRTFAVRYGPRVVFALAGFALAIGSLSAALVLYGRDGPKVGGIEALLIMLGSAVALILLRRWARRFDPSDPFGNHDRMVRITGLTSGAFGILLLWRLFSLAAIGVGHAEGPPRDPMGVWVEGREKGLIQVSAWVRLASASQRMVWDVVADFDGLARFMPNVEQSKVVARTDSTVHVFQVGKTGFIVRKRVETLLSFRPEAPWRLSFRQLEGDFERFDGAWMIQPGRGDTTVVHFRAWLTPGVKAPGFLVRSVIRKEFRRMMPAIAAEVRRRRGS